MKFIHLSKKFSSKNKYHSLKRSLVIIKLLVNEENLIFNWRNLILFKKYIYIKKKLLINR